MTVNIGQWQYLIALNNNPNDDVTLITSVAAGGVAGGAAPTVGAVNVWTDITQYVANHNMSRGRQHELSRFEASSLTVELVNITGVFNPWNTASPFYGLLEPLNLIQVRNTLSGVVSKRFTGQITAIVPQWADEMHASARIDASDLFRQLALSNITNAAYAATVIADGATSLYRLGEPLGNVAADSVAAKNGTYRSCKQGIAGALVTELDGAVDFGKRVGYVSLPTSVGVQANSSGFTIECWLQLHDVPIAGDAWFSQSNANSNVTAGLAPNPAGGVDLSFNWGNGTYATTSTTYQGPGIVGQYPADNAWHHVVICYTTNGTIYTRFYVDGVYLANTQGGYPNYFPIPVPLRVNLGTDAQQTVHTLNGQIDEVALYAAYQLSTAQIKNHYSFGAGPWLGQYSGARIASVLKTVGIITPAANIDTGNSVMQTVTSSLATTKTLSYLQLVEVSEGGAFFVKGDGTVRFVARDNIFNTPVALTLGDGGGSEVPFQPGPDLGLDDLDIWNEVVVTRKGGLPQTAASTASQLQYGRRTQSISDILLTTDTEAAQRAAWNLDHYTTPLLRLSRVDVRPAIVPNRIANILNMELLNKLTINRHYLPGGGDMFTQTALIEHISESVDMTTGDWIISFGVSVTDAKQYWILGDLVLGILGSTTRLAY